MKKTESINLFKKMDYIRQVETEIINQYKFQKMRCPVHLSIGQEAIAVGVCNNLDKNDIIFTNHRSHAHYLAKGGSLFKMLSELHGLPSGCAGGLGGSMHLMDLQKKIMPSIPIVGSVIPIAAGYSWSNKFLKIKKNIVVIFLGDGATEEGTFYETLNIVKLYGLRVLFICEDNNYSVYSAKNVRRPKQFNLKKLVESFGIEFKEQDGNLVEKVFKEAKEAKKKIIKYEKPYFLKFNTFRDIEHCGPNNDDNLNYRNLKEINFWRKKCPIKIYKNKILKQGKININEISKIQKKNKKIILLSFKKIKKIKINFKTNLKKLVYA